MTLPWIFLIMKINFKASVVREKAYQLRYNITKMLLFSQIESTD